MAPAGGVRCGVGVTTEDTVQGPGTASMWMGVEDHRVTRDNQGVGALRDGGAGAHEPTHGRA